MPYTIEQKIWSVLRFVMGFIFLWAFLDKLFGLGFATVAEKSWLAGVSPTAGFLQFGTSGAGASFFKQLSGSVVVDWLFMLGLVFVGTALILGVAMRLAGYVGALMMVLMYTALSLPPKNNPLFDEHIVYALVLIGLGASSAGEWYGLGKWWKELELVKKWKWLE
ncbi:MAG: hypothetical protein AAB657_04965 [Patescibacteria group bacterium]